MSSTTLSSENSDQNPVPSLKRRASSLLEQDESSRKRLKEELPGVHVSLSDGPLATVANLADTLAQDLQCGCCSALVYRPVIVHNCEHFFCGSCCVLWIKHGGTNCPSCRGIASLVTPSRLLQSLVDTLLRHAPHLARTQRERDQADAIYKGGISMRIPVPREPSPAPAINLSSEFIQPCPHCPPHNDWGWRCPQPIVDPNTDIDNAWRVDAGMPPGHGQCGNCENILALSAPTTSKCDLCQVSFCGIGVAGRCLASPILSQAPSHFADVGDLIQSADVYECFNGNTVEVDFLLDYLSGQGLTPAHIYREIAQHIQSQPRGFAPLLEMDLFLDIHPVAAGIDPDPQASRNKICKPCAAEVLLYGLKAWWIRERQKGLLQDAVLKRKDCPNGNGCLRQKDDVAHAKEFNHIFDSAPTSSALEMDAQEESRHDTSSETDFQETNTSSTSESSAGSLKAINTSLHDQLSNSSTSVLEELIVAETKPLDC